MVSATVNTRHQVERNWRLLWEASVDNSRHSAEIVLRYQAGRSFVLPLKACRQFATDVAYPFWDPTVVLLDWDTGMIGCSRNLHVWQGASHLLYQLHDASLPYFNEVVEEAIARVLQRRSVRYHRATSFTATYIFTPYPRPAYFQWTV